MKSYEISILKRVIKEQVLRILYEDVIDPSDPEIQHNEKLLNNILGDSYESFVVRLGKEIHDKKFIAAIKILANKHPLHTDSFPIKVVDLKPTQREIVLDKSLRLPLTNADITKKIMIGTDVMPPDKHIVTADSGTYVIDGHHRWSQVYCINPDAYINAVDLPIKNPIKALKATQLGIAASIGNIPTGEGGGTNLYGISHGDLVEYILKHLHTDVVEVFKEYGYNTEEEIAEYIWGNVQLLNKHNAPATPNAPARPIMPQTGDAPQWQNNTPKIESKKASVKELHQLIQKIVSEEIKKI